MNFKRYGRLKYIWLLNRKFKVRNIFATIGMVLTTVLFTVLFLVSIGTYKTLQYETFRQAGGDGQISLRYVSQDVYNNVKKHPFIKEIGLSSIITDDIKNLSEQEAISVVMMYRDEVSLKHSLIELTEGNWPTSENEIALDEHIMRLLDDSARLGDTVELDYYNGTNYIKKEFVVSGYWESNESNNLHEIIVADAFYTTYYDSIHTTNNNLVLSIKCEETSNLDSKLDRIINESGYSRNIEDSNFVDGVVKWSFISGTFEDNYVVFISMVVLVLIIMVTGYLIISNVYSISIINDIKFIGLTKLIGATNKQIRLTLMIQSLFTTFIGLPVGLLIGKLIGCQIIPSIISQSFFNGSSYKLYEPIWIYIIVICFVLITNMISVEKSIKMSKKISPLEANSYMLSKRYSDTTGSKTRFKGLFGMAIANVLSVKRQFIFVITSLSLSFVILATISVVANSFDMGRYIHKFADTDMIIADSKYFKYQYNGKEHSLEQRLLTKVEQIKEVEEVGSIFYDPNCFITIDADVLTDNIARGIDNKPMIQLFGYDEVSEKSFNYIEMSNTDMEYQGILLGVNIGENNNLVETPYKVGDVVELFYYTDSNYTDYQSRKYQVSGIIETTNSNHSRSFFTDYIFYLTKDAYKLINEDLYRMNINVTISKGQERSVDGQVDELISEEGNSLAFESKTKFIEDYGNGKKMFMLIGLIFVVFLSIIGVVNYLNTIVTGINTRYHEFALLEAVGMTKKQLRTMLFFESLIYAVFTFVITAIISVILSKTIVRGLIDQVWFMSAQNIEGFIFLIIGSICLISCSFPIIVVGNYLKGTVSSRLISGS